MTKHKPPLTDKELDILEELWNSDPSWAKDSLLVLRDLRALREAADMAKAWIVRHGDHDRDCHRFQYGLARTKPDECDCDMGVVLRRLAELMEGE